MNNYINLKGIAKIVASSSFFAVGGAYAFVVPPGGFDNVDINVGACTGIAQHYDAVSPSTGIGNAFALLSTPSVFDNQVNPHYDGATGIPFSSGTDISSLTPADIRSECGVADAVLTITGVATGAYADEDLVGFQLEGKDPDNGNAHTRWVVAVSGVTNTQVIAKKNFIAPTVDSVTGTAGVAISPFNVLSNDMTDGAASTVTNSILSIVTPATDAGVVLDVATGLLKTTAAVPAGSYPVTYQLCNAAAPTLCAQATATVTLDAPTPPQPSTPTPVPVDSPWTLLLAGLAVVGVALRIRSKC